MLCRRDDQISLVSFETFSRAHVRINGKMTDAALQKFSIPFTCSSQEPSTFRTTTNSNNIPNGEGSKVEDEDTKSAVKDNGSPALDDLQNTEMVSTKGAKNTIKAYVITEGGDSNMARKSLHHHHPHHHPQSPHKTIFEKWASLQCEEQRPSTKRQLSAESAAKCVSVRKRSMATSGDEPLKAPSYADLGTQPRKTRLPTSSSSQRKPRRQLFSSTGVFHKVDTHVISTGRELREQGVFSAQSIARAITQTARNELEKLRAIWVWLCHNIEYDLEGYLGLSPKLCSPDEVIKEGRGVCSGFSSVCVEMCREVGIECEEVSGYSKGIGYRPGRELANGPSDHMWNAAWVRGQWGLLDACWGAGTVNMESKRFIKRLDDFYFLTEPSEFINSHFPDEQHWQLLDKPISMEQFELRPLKTSAFYSLGLSFVHPTQCKITTGDGEVTVSLSSPEPLTFTYELRRRGVQTGALRKEEEQEQEEEVDGSCGLLSVTRQGMSLRLLPPEPGTYKLKLFARPQGDSGILNWVCSLDVECPSVRQCQPLPANPYQSWGLGTRAVALGVKDCSVPAKGGTLRVGDGGECEVVLHISRPLMTFCELSHPELEAGLAKRCMALQVAADHLSCFVLCPLRGFYRLSVFVRDYDDGSGPFQNAANFLLHCRGPGANLNSLYPPELGPWCGPGMKTDAARLSSFSHAGAVVNAAQGRCNITFHCSSPELQIHAALNSEAFRHDQASANRDPGGFPLSRHLLLTSTDSKVTVSVCLPRPGVYRLGLYGRRPPQQDYGPLCDYVLRSSCERRGDPFPCVYAAWGKGCVLLEPRSGLLAPQSWVRFRVKVPAATRVSAVGEKRAELKMNKSRVWEGEAFTGDVAQVKLVSATSESDDNMAVLLTFDVLGLESEP